MSLYDIAFLLSWEVNGNAGEVPVKFQSDQIILNINLVASRICEILQ